VSTAGANSATVGCSPSTQKPLARKTKVPAHKLPPQQPTPIETGDDRPAVRHLPPTPSPMSTVAGEAVAVGLMDVGPPSPASTAASAVDTIPMPNILSDAVQMLANRPPTPTSLDGESRSQRLEVAASPASPAPVPTDCLPPSDVLCDTIRMFAEMSGGVPVKLDKIMRELKRIYGCDFGSQRAAIRMIFADEQLAVRPASPSSSESGDSSDVRRRPWLPSPPAPQPVKCLKMDHRGTLRRRWDGSPTYTSCGHPQARELQPQKETVAATEIH